MKRNICFNLGYSLLLLLVLSCIIDGIESREMKKGGGKANCSSDSECRAICGSLNCKRSYCFDHKCQCEVADFQIQIIVPCIPPHV
ncbi:hypothetical protein M5689_024005 [Euphorbia peplus]|nr:hypothetical protein M5689_024005 [Euphorbia peplus]